MSRARPTKNHERMRIVVCVIAAALAACKANTEETFAQESCKYEKTEQTSYYEYQAGCAMYGTNPDGTSNGICVVPIWQKQAVRKYNIVCNKSEWRNE